MQLRTFNAKVRINTISITIKSLLMALTFVCAFGYIGRMYHYYEETIYIHAFLMVFIICYVLGLYKRKTITKAILPLLLFIIISAIAINFARAERYLVLILCCTFILTVKLDKDTLEQLIKMVSIVGFIFALSVIWQWLSPDTYYPVLRYISTDISYERAQYYLNSSSAYTGFACESSAACLCISSAICCNFTYLFFREERHNYTVIKIVSILIMYFAIFLCQRRMFMLSIPAILAVMGTYFLMRSKKAIHKLLGVAVAFAIAALLYFILFDDIYNVLTKGGTKIQLSNREAYWELAMRMFRESPWFGKGLRSYDEYYIEMSGRDLSFAGAHNSYLQMLAEIGIIGTACYIGFILYTLLKTIKTSVKYLRNDNRKTGQYVMVSLLMQIVIIVLAMSESPFFLPQSLVMYFLFVNISLNCQELSA